MFSLNSFQMGDKVEMYVRELDALGYRVVPISDSYWNSMAMATYTDKTNYLMEVLGLTKEKRRQASNGNLL